MKNVKINILLFLTFIICATNAFSNEVTLNLNINPILNAQKIEIKMGKFDWVEVPIDTEKNFATLKQERDDQFPSWFIKLTDYDNKIAVYHLKNTSDNDVDNIILDQKNTVYLPFENKKHNGSFGTISCLFQSWGFLRGGDINCSLDNNIKFKGEYPWYYWVTTPNTYIGLYISDTDIYKLIGSEASIEGLGISAVYNMVWIDGKSKKTGDFFDITSHQPFALSTILFTGDGKIINGF